MRLVRLTSPNNNTADPIPASWTNWLNDGFIIKPNSKIGLMNASIFLSADEIYIGNGNNNFYYSTYDTNTPIHVYIANGVYDINSLIAAINASLNASVTWAYDGLDAVNQSRIGFLSYFSLSQNPNVLNLTVMRGPEAKIDMADPNAFFQSAALTYAGAAPNDYFYRTVAPVAPPDYTAFVVGKKPIIPTAGYVRCKRIDNNPVGVEARKFILGLTDKYVPGMAEIRPEDCDYWMGVLGDDSLVSWWDGTNIQTTARTCTVSCLCSIELSGGQVRYATYLTAAAGTAAVWGTSALAFDTTKTYLPVLIILEAPDVAEPEVGRYTVPIFVKDPRIAMNADGELIHHNPALHANVHEPYAPYIDYNVDPLGATPPVPPPNLANVVSTFIFNGVGISRIIGFWGNISLIGANPLPILATSEYAKFNKPSTLVVTLDNLKLDSYDASEGTNQRRNILAVLPNVTDQTTGLFLAYQMSYPIMLNLNNVEPINMRNFQVSIYNYVDSGESLITIADSSTLTLIIDD